MKIFDTIKEIKLDEGSTDSILVKLKTISIARMNRTNDELFKIAVDTVFNLVEKSDNIYEAWILMSNFAEQDIDFLKKKVSHFKLLEQENIIFKGNETCENIIIKEGFNRYYAAVKMLQKDTLAISKVYSSDWANIVLVKQDSIKVIKSLIEGGWAVSRQNPNRMILSKLIENRCCLVNLLLEFDDPDIQIDVYCSM